jgi:hypothetical protein
MDRSRPRNSRLSEPPFLPSTARPRKRSVYFLFSNSAEAPDAFENFLYHKQLGS